jgi:hypothetical protein
MLAWAAPFERYVRPQSCAQEVVRYISTYWLVGWQYSRDRDTDIRSDLTTFGFGYPRNRSGSCKPQLKSRFSISLCTMSYHPVMSCLESGSRVSSPQEVPRSIGQFWYFLDRQPMHIKNVPFHQHPNPHQCLERRPNERLGNITSRVLPVFCTLPRPDVVLVDEAMVVSSGTPLEQHRSPGRGRVRVQFYTPTSQRNHILGSNTAPQPASSDYLRGHTFFGKVRSRPWRVPEVAAPDGLEDDCSAAAHILGFVVVVFSPSPSAQFDGHSLCIWSVLL